MSNLVKILLIGLLLSNSTYLKAQKDTTILFHDAHPVNKKEVLSLKKSNFGIYKDTANLAWMEINEIGVFKTTTVLMQMPKDELEKDEKYKVIDGWIYGVTKTDSLPCTLDEGIYHFGYPYRTEVLSFNGKYSLRKIDANTFLLNSQQKTDSTWQISQFYADGKTIEYYGFDQYEFASKNDTLGFQSINLDENTVVKSLILKDPEFFEYPGVQKYFRLESVYIRED
jgi:hypothetical protein